MVPNDGLALKAGRPGAGLRAASDRVADTAAGTLVLLMALACLAPFIAPYDTMNPDLFSLDSSLLGPGTTDAAGRHWLGTDDQGRDLLSCVLLGLRISVLVGVSATGMAAAVGGGMGLMAGFRGGLADAVFSRAADVQATFPALLVALLADGVARAAYPRAAMPGATLLILVASIGLARWPQFFRVIRACVTPERERGYVLAARAGGMSAGRILLTHILPNVARPAAVVAGLAFALSIMDEATLSFLGLGLPSGAASLGTMIRIGSQYLFSGSPWMTLFPAVTLAGMVMAVNVLGGRLRSAAP